MDNVTRAGDPDGPVGFKEPLAFAEPLESEIVVAPEAARAVPLAFVDRDHLAGVAGNTAVREEIRRVGEDHVETLAGEKRQQ